MEDKGIVVFKQGEIEITKEQKATFVGFVSEQNPTEAELMLHFDFCARKGTHPLERLIYFTKRQGKYTPITSIDYMRIRAESSKAYAGSDDAVFKGVTKIGQKDYPQSATVTVWKLVEGQRCPFTATARWSEYAPPDLTNNAAFMWRTKPYVMLAKCAEALALRKAFPGQLQGLYTSEEFDRDSATVVHQPNQSHKDVEVIDAEATVVKDEGVKQPDQEKPLATKEPEKAADNTEKTDDGLIVVWDGKTRKNPKEILSTKAVESFKRIFAENEILKVKQHLIAHLKSHFGVASISDLSYEKATAFAKHMRGEGDDPRWYGSDKAEEPENPVAVHDHETSSGYSDEYLNGIVKLWAMQDERVKSVSTYAGLPNEMKAHMMEVLVDLVGPDKSIESDDVATIAEVLSQ